MTENGSVGLRPGETADSGLRVAVDMPWDSTARMGTGAYSETMVRALASVAPRARIMLIIDSNGPCTIRLPNVTYHTPPPVRVRSEGFRQVSLPDMLEKLEAHCLFAPATLLPTIKPCPMVSAVHDLTAVEHPEYYNTSLAQHLIKWLEPSIRSADHVIAISSETREGLRRHFDIPDERVTIIPQPVRDVFLRPLEQERVAGHLAKLEVRQPFYFHLSNLAPHKNVRFIVEVLARLREKGMGATPVMVIAGGVNAPDRPFDFLEYAQTKGLGAAVQYLGPLDDEQVQALYQRCEAFLFPSLAEGWGLPVAEASALGARVLASPFVPAAHPKQRLSLDVDVWVNALASPVAARSPSQPHDAASAGRALYNVLQHVARRSASVTS